MNALEGKLAQLSAKRKMVGDKIVVEVQTAHIALSAAREQYQQAQEAVRLAEDMANRERQNLQAGLSDLLKVTLREQYAVEAALKAIEAQIIYYHAEADLRAALGVDALPQ
jgi:outer membrane protein TolC